MSTDDQNAAGTVYDTVRDDDGNVVSSTATTTTASGEVVSVVEREFDGDGNVVAATYTDHSVDPETGETDTDVNVYESGVMTEEVSTRTSADGTVLEKSVTTFDADGDRDVTTQRTYDPGGGPLETRTTYYTDDGERMRTLIRSESGRTVVSHESGTHVRTDRNDDGTVTRQSVQVDETGTVRYSTTQVTDASGQIQTSSETYNDGNGDPENVIEVEYTDARATSMTTTATDEDGVHVSERRFDEEGTPTTEVRTSYDTEGNVTDTSTVTSSSETSGTSSGNADGHGSVEALDPGSLAAFREAVDLADLGQPTTPLDATSDRWR